ncbi:hypothetical protein D3C81_2007650 [compost metagenome]
MPCAPIHNFGITFSTTIGFPALSAAVVKKGVTTKKLIKDINPTAKASRLNDFAS